MQNKQEEIKILNDVSCRNCDKGLGGKIIKTFNFLHLFFIPLFRWNEKYYIMCSGCNSVYEIPQDKAKRIEKGKDIEITYWDLSPIKTRYDNSNYSSESRCSYCGKVMEPNFKYCPYCSVKIK